MHLGGPDLTAAEVTERHFSHPGGDGGLCRWPQCDCFNFCDCGAIAAEIDSEIEELTFSIPVHLEGVRRRKA
jgi:hypothetical protein